ncbi:MAG: sulfatase [Prolixibacteraceae bacterium]
MNHFQTLKILAGISGITCFNTAYSANQPSPNILVITCHDLGQNLNCYGVKTVNSPNLDLLASKGVMFRNFYSTSCVCSPGRGSLFTGRYPQSNGLMGLTHAPWWWKLNDNEKHIAELLKARGYSTTLIGFTHVGEPGRLGFENHLSANNNAKETVSEAINFFKKSRNEDNPFFLKIGFSEVHDPYRQNADSTKGINVPGFLTGTSEIRRELAKFQGEIRFLDECVGKIMDAIAASEVAKNTIIVFTSDHGMGFPGAKWTTRKAGVEVPFIIYQPESIFSGGKIFNEIMSNVDVLPTFFEYAGFTIPKNIEGVSFKKLISGETKIQPRKSAFAQFTPDMKRDNQSRTIISGKFQLIWYFDAGRTVAYPLSISPSRFSAHVERENTTASRPFYELYNTENDPFELANIGMKEEYAGKVKELSKELLSWMKSVKDPLLKGPVVTPYYEKSRSELETITK